MDKRMAEHNKLHQLIDKMNTNVLSLIESFERQLNQAVNQTNTISTKFIDGGFSDWTTWSECSQTCGVEIKTRTRTCTNPSPWCGGKDCSGASSESQDCHRKPCPTDCSDVKLHNPDSLDGVYEVVLWNTSRTVQVYCDMTTDGGGWTVFQNRYDGSVDFYRNYSQYEHGFGDLQTEFLLGLNYTEEMTSQTENELRIDLMTANGTTAYEVLSPFSLSAPNYVLNVGSITSSYNIDYRDYSFGRYHNGQAFSTYDHDVDNYSLNCALLYHGGWWYKKCFHATLNGVYNTPGTDGFRGIYYLSINDWSMKQTRMSFRKT